MNIYQHWAVDLLRDKRTELLTDTFLDKRARQMRIDAIDAILRQKHKLLS
jgi:hypothetical protein